MNRLINDGALRTDQRVIQLYFLVPPMVILIGITAYPFVYSVIASLRSLAYGEYVFVGLANYWRLFTGGRFIHSLYITLVFTGIAVAVQTVLGMFLALLYSERIPGASILRLILILPMVTTPIVVAMVFRQLIYPPEFGVLNYFLDLLRLSALRLKWHCDAKTALFSLILVDTWRSTPFAFLVFLAGVESLPREPHEAASIDGASFLQRFFHITLPLLRHVVMVVIVFRVIGCFKIFDIVYGITEGGPGLATENISVYIYLQMFRFNKIGMASAGSVVAMLITFFLVFVIYKAILGKESVR